MPDVRSGRHMLGSKMAGAVGVTGTLTRLAKLTGLFGPRVLRFRRQDIGLSRCPLVIVASFPFGNRIAAAPVST